MPRPLSASELEWIANYLTQNYAGLGLAEIRERLVGELDGERREVDRRMAATVALAQATMTPSDGEDMRVSVPTNLMGGTHGTVDVQRPSRMFEAVPGKTPNH